MFRCFSKITNLNSRDSLSSVAEEQEGKNEQSAYPNEGLRSIKIKCWPQIDHHKIKNCLVSLKGSILLICL